MSTIPKPYFEQTPCSDSEGVALIELNLSILRRLMAKLKDIKEQDMTDNTGRHHATIGMHVRHIIEFYQAFFQVIDKQENSPLCYDNRKRDVEIEESKQNAIIALENIQEILMTREFYNRDVLLSATLSPNASASTIKSTIYRELFYVLEHSIHHMAIIKMIGNTLNIRFDEMFGVANSTLAWRQSAK